MAGRRHDPAIKAEALRLYTEGHSQAVIVRQLGVDEATLRHWLRAYDPAHYAKVRESTGEALSQKVIEVVFASLEALRVRAVTTSDPDWIRQQDAGALAQLDAATWDRLIRVLSSLRPQSPDASR